MVRRSPVPVSLLIVAALMRSGLPAERSERLKWSGGRPWGQVAR